MESSNQRTYRHSLVTRATHAAFAAAFAGLVVTGTQIYLHTHWLRNPGTLHQIFALTMIASGLAYFCHAAATGKLNDLLFSARDAAGLIPMATYYLRLRKEPPPYTTYNPLQKIAYTIVLLMIAPLIAATGLAMWPHLALFRPLARVFGGRRSVQLWHVGFGFELIVFFSGHMLMIATTGLRDNLRAIVTGVATSRHPHPIGTHTSA